MDDTANNTEMDPRDSRGDASEQGTEAPAGGDLAATEATAGPAQTAADTFADLGMLPAASWTCPVCGARGVVIAQAVIEQIAKGGIIDRCGQCGAVLSVRPRMIASGFAPGPNRHERRAAATQGKRLVLAKR